MPFRAASRLSRVRLPRIPGRWHSDGVTVRLEFGVPGSRDARLRTAWTPGRDPVRDWAWVQHGFARGGRHLAGLAGALGSAGVSVVCPDIASLTPRRSMHDPAFLTAAALTIARAVDAGIPQARGVEVGSGGWVGVGHSAGAAVIVHAAGVLAARPGEPGAPRGLVLIDPVDTVGGLLQAALPGLPADLPITVLACPPSRCNRGGETVAWLRRSGRAEIRDLPGLSHADPERIPASLLPVDVAPAGRAVRWACGAPGSADRVARLGEDVVAQVRRDLGGDAG